MADEELRRYLPEPSDEDKVRSVNRKFLFNVSPKHDPVTKAVNITDCTIPPSTNLLLRNQHIETLVFQPGNTKGDAR